MSKLEKVEKAIEKGKEAALIKLAYDKDEEVRHVSYTHLDVYKRQELGRLSNGGIAFPAKMGYNRAENLKQKGRCV